MTVDSKELRSRHRLDKPILVSVGTLLVAAFVLFQPIVAFLVEEQVDYADHLSYLMPTMNMVALQKLVSMFPHFLYHLSVFVVFKVFSVDNVPDAGLAVSVFAYLFGTLAVFWLMTQMLGRPRTITTGLFYAGLSLALMVLMPIDIFTPDNLFVGYIGVNAYHNPTIVLLKPFAVILFWCAGQVFQNNMDATGRKRKSVPIWLCAIVSVFCVLAKPSNAIALLPALIVIAGYRIMKRQALDWRLLFWGILFPAGYVLVFQMALFTSSTGFIFAPLAVIYSWVRINPDAPNGIIWKFLLSILFPLLVYVFYFKAAVKSVYLNLAWVVFGFGAAYMYLLAEGGSRLPDANFTWSAICALFILFIVSTAFFIQQIQVKRGRFGEAFSAEQSQKARTEYWRGLIPSARLTIVIVVFALHTLSGIYWYYIHITATSMGDIIANKW